MGNNNKGNGFIEFIIILLIVTLVFILIFTIADLVSSANEESKEREKKIVKSSEVIKVEKYMVILYKDNGLCDTLYSNSEGNIRSVGEFIFYESDDFDIVSKHTIISIPITIIPPTKDEYDDMHEFSSGIDLDDY